MDRVSIAGRKNLNPKKAMCARPFQGWKAEKIFRYLGELGYDGVEIDPYAFAGSAGKIGRAKRRDLRRSAFACGLEVVGIHSVTKSPDFRMCINHPSSSVRAGTVKQLGDLISFCRDIGGSILVFGGSKERNLQGGLDSRQAWMYAVESFESLLELAEKESVTICLEPLSHRLTNFITTASEAKRMVEEVDHPNFRMMLDVRSASDEDRPIPDLIRDSAPNIAHFHANDDGGGGPGSGGADYHAISGALGEIGYSGYLSVEVFNNENPRKIAAESLEFLRKHFN